MPEPRKFGVTFAPTGTNIGTMTNLTDRQKQVLDFVTAYLAAHQRPPSAWDIANALGLSQTGGVRKHLQALEKKGHLTLAPGTARGIRMSRPLRAHQHPALTLPILGRVAAGLPISAQADVHGEMLLDRAAFFPRPDYLLRVQGDSMRDDGIFDGDLVAVSRTNVADDGQIVVARIDGELTIKRLKRTRTRVQLLPRNPDFAPIEVPPDADFGIEGLYCGLVRRG